MRRGRKQKGGCRELGEDGELGFSLGRRDGPGDDGGDGFTALRMCLAPLDCTLKNGEAGELHVA